MLIKIVLPQAAQLGINFLIGKSVMLRLLEGPVYGLITEDRIRKKTAPDSNQTLDLYVTRWGLDHCATTVVQ